MKRLIAILLTCTICFALCACGSVRTLEEITSAKHGGGRLRFQMDTYTVVEVYFTSESGKGTEREGTCFVSINHYKAASYSPSGKIFDYAENKKYPCEFSEHSLTLNGFDHYTYSVETKDGKEYVVFSKAFLGQTRWSVNN